MVNRVILIVIDSVGVGYMPDAYRFNDDKVNTLVHIYREMGKLNIPNLCLLGLGRVVDIGCKEKDVTGCYGRMSEVSPNKDTTAGHWEIAGVALDWAFPTYADGFPEEIIEEFEEKIGTKILGNYPRSGTEILKELGSEHVSTGYPIVYTSADSVFQIAAHEDIVPLEKLYEYCLIAREILKGKHSVARVIARPFKGEAPEFERNNTGRKDYSIQSPGETLLDVLKEKGHTVTGIGKIGDLFGHRGLTREIKTAGNMDGVDRTLKAIREYKGEKGLIFVNLVDFDMVYGHRRNVEGYAKALEEFDTRIPEIMDALSGDEILMITADHGCDPTYTEHTDHTREYVPLLVYGEDIKKDVNLGTRESFADCGQTIADMLGVKRLESGVSFKKDILEEVTSDE